MLILGRALSCLPAIKTSRCVVLAVMNGQVFRGETLFIGDCITEMTPRLDRPTEPLSFRLPTSCWLARNFLIVGDYACDQFLKTETEAFHSQTCTNFSEFFTNLSIPNFHFTLYLLLARTMFCTYKLFHMKLSTRFSLKLFAIEKNVSNETYVVSRGTSYHKSYLWSCFWNFKVTLFVFFFFNRSV